MQDIQSGPALKLCVFQEKTLPSGFSGKWHSHPFHEFGMVLRGQCRWHLQGGRTVMVPEGHVILIARHCQHREEADRRVRLAWVGFSTRKPFLEKSGRVVDLGADVDLVGALFRQIYHEQHSTGTESREICTLALRQIVLLHSRAARLVESGLTGGLSLSPRQSQMAHSVAAYLDQNAGRPLSLEQVARYHNLSAPHLSKLFQKQFGVTPTAYRKKRRIERAKELLRTPRAIKEIAGACGYTDAPHFCREFRQMTGRTPGECRGTAVAVFAAPKTGK